MYSTLKLAFEDKIAILTLSRAEKRNAISHQLINDFLAALQEVENSSAHILILAAEGKAFCAGLDLEDLVALTKHTAEENYRHSERIATLCRSLYYFSKTTIAAVNGAAIAGGAGLATLCDFTLASTAATFGYTEVRIGFVPAIISAFLVRQVGEKHARDLLLTGRIITAEEAYRMGLVNEVVEAVNLLEGARRLAEQLLENSPASLRATKALLRSYIEDGLERDIQRGMEANASIRMSADFKEGVRSFLERRKPQWSE
ncbi:MAG: enoyl-CoA hydratase [Acidobacteria bacterium]|nr:MAG: enoyl-CoA hydratase [Acidobacteriota bacterium]